MGRAAAVLRSPRGAAFLALLAGLSVYYGVVNSLPNLGIWVDVLIVAIALMPAAFALVLLVLPLRRFRGLFAVGIAFVVLAFVWDIADLEVASNFSKLGAMAALGFWFLGYFERLSWVVIVAGIIPIVDAVSVWRGPTRHIVSERPEVFDLLSFTFPVPKGAFQLGLPDLLFFSVFLAAAARWALRVHWTWLVMVASFGITMAVTIWKDPFGIGGLPALPLLAISFLVANADLLWRQVRAERAAAGEAA